MSCYNNYSQCCGASQNMGCNTQTAGCATGGNSSVLGGCFGSFSCIINLIIILIVLQFLSEIIGQAQC